MLLLISSLLQAGELSESYEPPPLASAAIESSIIPALMAATAAGQGSCIGPGATQDNASRDKSFSIQQFLDAAQTEVSTSAQVSHCIVLLPATYAC